jgi:PIN domain nuclease of toxin-antitoxin system
MNILLDTHTLIWFIEGSKELSQKARNLVADIDNPCFASAASIWEIALKQSIGKLELKNPFEKLSALMWENSIDILPIRFEHAKKIIGLPFHHKDPFDRIIIAQALVEEMQIISKDEQFDNYLDDNTKRIW